MKKVLLSIICIFIVLFFLVLDEKERKLFFISSEQADSFYDFKEIPWTYDEYKVWVGRGTVTKLGKMISVLESWKDKSDGVSTDIQLTSYFYVNSSFTIIDYFHQSSLDAGFEKNKVLNQEGFYRATKQEYINKDLENVMFLVEELYFSLEGISYEFIFGRESINTPIEHYGVTNIVNFFSDNNFKK